MLYHAKSCNLLKTNSIKYDVLVKANLFRLRHPVSNKFNHMEKIKNHGIYSNTLPPRYDTDRTVL